MKRNLSDVIKGIIETYGDRVFGNIYRTNAMLRDLANDMPRERLLARHFIESGSYRLLKKAGGDYLLTRGKIITRLTNEYCLERNAAGWITHVFSKVLGYEENDPPPFPEGGFKQDAVLHTANVTTLSGRLALGVSHAAFVLPDGTAVARGRNGYLQCDVGGWRGVVAVAAGDAHTVGLLADGRVMATGRNNFYQCDTADMTGVVAVAAFGDDTYCVCGDGSVAAAGKTMPDLSGFDEIASVAWHPEGVYGIRYDGTALLSLAAGSEAEEREWARTLTGAVHIISTYVMGSVVLRDDGRVYKMGEPDGYYSNARDVVSITDLADGFAALRADGTVRVLPYDSAQPYIPTEADDWRDIIAIYGRYKRLVGLDARGELFAASTDPDWLARNGGFGFIDEWNRLWTNG